MERARSFFRARDAKPRRRLRFELLRGEVCFRQRFAAARARQHGLFPPYPLGALSAPHPFSEGGGGVTDNGFTELAPLIVFLIVLPYLF